MPHELTISQKNCRFQVLSFLILCNDNESFLNQIVICNKKSILYNNQWLPSQWLDWEEAAKHFPKPNSHTHTHTHTHTERIMVTVVLSDTSLICYSFLNPCKSITSEKYAQQINGMHQNPQCLQLVLVHRKGLILSCDNTWPHVVRPMLQMLKELGCKVLPHLPFSPALSPIDYHFLKQLNNFCRENSTASRTQKMLSNGSSNPRAQIFMLQE